MALLLPPSQSLRPAWRHGLLGVFVLCTAHLRGQGPWPVTGEFPQGGSGLQEMMDASGPGVSPGLEADADAGNATDDLADPAPPSIVVQPIDRTIPEGMRVTFSVGLDHRDATARFQWQRDGAVIPGANSASYTIAAVGLGDAGHYACEVQNDLGAATSDPATLTVVSAAQGARFANFSVVTSLDTPRAETTVDFAVGGAGTAGAKPILVRAVGPSLARFGIADRNPAPLIEQFSGATKIAQNDGWSGQAAVVEAGARVGAFPLVPADSSDAAMLINAVPASSSTLKISGRGGATGIVLAEIYDATPAATFTPQTPRLLNFSVLKMIPAGSNLSVGFVITGQTTKTVLVRVIGPSLTNWNVAGALPDPVLTLLQDATPIATNDNWGGAPELTGASAAVGAAALDPTSKDAALVMNLARGSYAVQARDAANRGGVALVEIYEVP